MGLATTTSKGAPGSCVRLQPEIALAGQQQLLAYSQMWRNRACCSFSGPAITEATCIMLTRWSHCPAVLPPQVLLGKILLLLLDKEPSLHWSLHYLELSGKYMASLEAVLTGQLLTPYVDLHINNGVIYSLSKVSKLWCVIASIPCSSHVSTLYHM